MATVCATQGLSTGIRATVPRAATERRPATASSARCNLKRGDGRRENGEPGSAEAPGSSSRELVNG